MDKNINKFKTNKCYECKKKLSLIRSNITCKCLKKYFCDIHFLEHNCDYNYKNDYFIYNINLENKIDKI